MSQDIINKIRLSPSDTGSAGVQIALKTMLISKVSEHLKTHKKDNHSRRGLTIAVEARKRLVNYLKATDETKYKQVIQALGLRK
jgi:small subunit ribosomal protein S15